jgi:hypothetical protein
MDNTTFASDYKTCQALCSKLNKIRGLKQLQNPFLQISINKVFQSYDRFRGFLDCGNLKYIEVKENIPIARVINILNFSDESAKSYIEKRHYLSHMRSLMNWTLFIHTATQMSSFPDIIPKEMEDSVNEFIDWFIPKTLLPFSSILEIQRAFQEKHSINKLELGKVQMILIEYLSKKIDEEKAIFAASNILSIWYKECKPQTSKISKSEYESWNSDLLINNTISKAPELKVKIENLLESLFFMNFGDFHPSTENIKLPKSMIPTRYITSIEAIELENSSMVRKIESFVKMDLNSLHNYKYFEDIPVYLVVDKDNLHSGWVKIAHRISEAPKPEHMLHRVYSLIYYLISCHSLLKKAISISDGDERNYFLEETQTNFMRWIENICLEPEWSMPLFGKIEKIDKTLNKYKFGDIQISLIYYFSFARSYRMLPKISFSLIGCWFKTFYNYEWSKIFRDDDSFIVFMCNLLFENPHQFEFFRKQ